MKAYNVHNHLPNASHDTPADLDAEENQVMHTHKHREAVV